MLVKSALSVLVVTGGREDCESRILLLHCFVTPTI